MTRLLAVCSNINARNTKHMLYIFMHLPMKFSEPLSVFNNDAPFELFLS